MIALSTLKYFYLISPKYVESMISENTASQVSRCVSVEYFIVKGHPNVKATHSTTFEFTKENFLTHRGDCIVGISASKALRDFSKEFKDLARNPSSVIYVIILTPNGIADIVFGLGSQELTYDDPVKVIIRKSSYISGNTAVIRANKAAKDLNRDLINYLKSNNAYAIVVMVAIDLKCFGSLPLTPNLS